MSKEGDELLPTPLSYDVRSEKMFSPRGHNCWNPNFEPERWSPTSAFQAPGSTKKIGAHGFRSDGAGL